MHRFIALDGPPGGTESQAWMNAAFHKTMVLFHYIVYVFALPQCTTRWELALLLKGLEDWRIHSIFVDRDDAWGGRMLRPERLPEEALSGTSITPGSQQKVDGLARGIDGTVEIILPPTLPRIWAAQAMPLGHGLLVVRRTKGKLGD
jgi:hypothetical protein